MAFNPNIHHRRSMRLQGYDYSQAGAYFITICTQNRKCMFGKIADGKIALNPAGQMVQTVWDEIPLHYTGIEIDAFAIMPNHIHGIIVIPAIPVTHAVGAGPRACPPFRAPPDTPRDNEPGQPRGVAPTPKNTGNTGNTGNAENTGTLSLGDVVHRFKTMTTKRYVDGVHQLGWQRFPGKLWQRNYWEHIIRNEMELNRIREYIRANPTRWEFDRLNLDGGAIRSTMVRESVFNYPSERWMV